MLQISLSFAMGIDSVNVSVLIRMPKKFKQVLGVPIFSLKFGNLICVLIDGMRQMRHQWISSSQGYHLYSL